MTGDIDTRNSDVLDYKNDGPGANDNASGMAGTIEAARVLSKYKFDYNIVYLGLSGEEQSLFGGKGFAEYAKNNNWDIIGVINNDIIGNIDGVDGVIETKPSVSFLNPLQSQKPIKKKQTAVFTEGKSMEFLDNWHATFTKQH